MIHRATQDFWSDYEALPLVIRERADKQFDLLKENPQHPSLHFKKVIDRHGCEVWSVRVNLRYRALAEKTEDGYRWFWIGEHGSYDMLI